MNLRSAAAAVAFALGGCSSGPRLPVHIADCHLQTSPPALVAQVRSEADRPIASLNVLGETYADYRFVHVETGVRLPRELDPGATAGVQFPLEAAQARIGARMSKCVVTRIDFLDGTSESLRR